MSHRYLGVNGDAAPLAWQRHPDTRFGGAVYVSVAVRAQYFLVCGDDHVKTFYRATDRAETCIGRSVSIAARKHCHKNMQVEAPHEAPTQTS